MNTDLSLNMVHNIYVGAHFSVCLLTKQLEKKLNVVIRLHFSLVETTCRHQLTSDVTQAPPPHSSVLRGYNPMKVVSKNNDLTSQWSQCGGTWIRSNNKKMRKKTSKRTKPAKPLIDSGSVVCPFYFTQDVWHFVKHTDSRQIMNHHKGLLR